MVVTNMNDAPELLRHSRKNKKRSILVKTTGVRSNRADIGNRARVVSGGLAQ